MTHRFIYPLLGQNMDFEESALAPWLKDTNGDASSVVETSTATAAHGTRSLKMRLQGTDTWAGAYHEQPFAPEAGQTLALHFQAKSGGTIGGTDLDAYIWEIKDGTPQDFSSLYLSSILGHGWKKFTLLHTVQSAGCDTLAFGFYTYKTQDVYADDAFVGALWEPRGATRFDVKSRIARHDNESASGEVESLAFSPHDEVALGWKRLYGDDAGELGRMWRFCRQGGALAFWFDRDETAERHWRRMMLLKKTQPLAMGRGPLHYESVELSLRSLPED